MKSLLTLAFCFAASFLLVLPEAVMAQNSNDLLTREELSSYATSTGVDYTRTSRRVTGNPYLNKDWKRGYIILGDNARSEDVLIRLNTHQQAVEFSRGPEETIYVIPPNNLKGFVIYNDYGDVRFQNGYYSEEEDIDRNTLLRVIHDGETKLLVHHKTALQEDMASYGMASKIDEYIDRDTYYLVTADGTFHDIRLRKRDVMRRLSDEEDEINRFANENNLDFGEEPELARILAHYDSLKSSGSAEN